MNQIPAIVCGFHVFLTCLNPLGGPGMAVNAGFAVMWFLVAITKALAVTARDRS